MLAVGLTTKKLNKKTRKDNTKLASLYNCMPSAKLDTSQRNCTFLSAWPVGYHCSVDSRVARRVCVCRMCLSLSSVVIDFWAVN